MLPHVALEMDVLAAVGTTVTVAAAGIGGCCVGVDGEEGIAAGKQTIRPTGEAVDRASLSPKVLELLGWHWRQWQQHWTAKEMPKPEPEPAPEPAMLLPAPQPTGVALGLIP